MNANNGTAQTQPPSPAREIRFTIEGDIAVQVAKMAKSAKLPIPEAIARAILDEAFIHNLRAAGKSLWVERSDGARAPVSFSPAPMGGSSPEGSEHSIEVSLTGDVARVADETARKSGSPLEETVYRAFQAFAFLLDCRQKNYRLLVEATDGSFEHFEFVPRAKGFKKTRPAFATPAPIAPAAPQSA